VKFHITAHVQQTTVSWWEQAKDEIDALWKGRRAYEAASAVEIRRAPDGMVVASWGSGSARRAS